MITIRRDTAFSYECMQCSRCCHDKLIRVNPYEVMRLAYGLGLGTAEFIEKYTDEQGTALKRVEAGACVFLTPQGCRVHRDRPLVCRLYPLGRHLSAEGVETFSRLTPHPRSEGVYGDDGTAGSYLESQGAGPFTAAVDRYLDLFSRMAAFLYSLGSSFDVWPDEGGLELLDPDSFLERYCMENALEAPADPESRMELHIKAVNELLENLRRAHGREKSEGESN